MKEKYTCPNCHLEFLTRYAKSCGNCFACTGCEIYVCPGCEKEVVVIPLKKSGNV